MKHRITNRIVTAQEVVDTQGCDDDETLLGLIGDSVRMSDILILDIPEEDRVWTVLSLIQQKPERAYAACALVCGHASRGSAPLSFPGGVEKEMRASGYLCRGSSVLDYPQKVADFLVTRTYQEALERNQGVIGVYEALKARKLESAKQACLLQQILLASTTNNTEGDTK